LIDENFLEGLDFSHAGELQPRGQFFVTRLIHLS